MIIWSGFGFLAGVITFGSCLAFNLVLDEQFGDGFYSNHPWAIGSALFVGGAISACVGFALKGRADRFVVDEETGERLIINNSSHTFFFIPMHWAGVLIAVAGVCVAISSLFN